MKSICVFVGANCGLSQQYTESTIELARQIARRNLRLVYGGADIGLMGILANNVLSAGGEVIGVIPQQLIGKEIEHINLTKLYIVDSIQERKLMMADLSDAFIALPGGLGTLEEIFEIWNAVKIGLYNKPIGLLNSNGYFNFLINFLTHSKDQGFIKQSQLDLVTILDNSDDLLNKMGFNASPDFIDGAQRNPMII